MTAESKYRQSSKAPIPDPMLEPCVQCGGEAYTVIDNEARCPDHGGHVVYVDPDTLEVVEP